MSWMRLSRLDVGVRGVCERTAADPAAVLADGALFSACAAPCAQSNIASTVCVAVTPVRTMLFKSDQLPVKLKFEATAAAVESTTVSVPVRGTVPVPLKLIVIVQEPPPAMVLPEQLSVPLLKRFPATAAFPNVTEPPPTTLSVTVLDTVPAGLPNASVLPDNVPKVGELYVTRGATPMPDKLADTGDGG
jgi:hypothetical protein